MLYLSLGVPMRGMKRAEKNDQESDHGSAFNDQANGQLRITREGDAEVSIRVISLRRIPRSDMPAP